MELTTAQLAALEPGSYHLIDIRDERSREYGMIPGAQGLSPEELLAHPPRSGQKIVIYCARGQFSLDAAEALREDGLEAYSLQGG